MDDLVSFASEFRGGEKLENQILFKKAHEEYDKLDAALSLITRESDCIQKLLAYCALDGIKITSVCMNDTETVITYEYKWVPSDGGAPRWDTGVTSTCITSTRTEDAEGLVADVIRNVFWIRYYLKGRKAHVL